MSRFSLEDPRANDWPSVADQPEPCEDCGRQSAVGPCPFCVAEVAISGPRGARVVGGSLLLGEGGAANGSPSRRSA